MILWKSTLTTLQVINQGDLVSIFPWSGCFLLTEEGWGRKIPLIYAKVSVHFNVSPYFWLKKKLVFYIKFLTVFQNHARKSPSHFPCKISFGNFHISFGAPPPKKCVCFLETNTVCERLAKSPTQRLWGLCYPSKAIVIGPFNYA